MTPADGGNGLITGNREMDEEHALQLQLLHELVQNVESGDGPAALEIFDRLEQFTSAHFLAEELLMRLHAYPHFEAHRAEHNRFVEDLKALRAQLAAGQDGAVKDEADALARRLVAHIATADNALGEFHRSAAAAGG